MNYTENVIVPERTLLVSLDTGEYDAEESLRELWELAKSGGAEPIATMMQKRPSPETATCVGSGMVEEIRNFCENNEIELIIFDRELTPTQIRNLENATDVRVVDRTMLILDIFAQRAQSRAGKVQVEAAQLRKAGALVSEEYVAEGLLIHARVEPREMALIKPYIVENNSKSENV